MSMRARKPSEYTNDGNIKGDHKDTYQSMFDNRAQTGKQKREEVTKMLNEQKEAYDRQLFSDWIVKVYDRCRIDCLVNPGMYNARNAQNSHELNQQMDYQVNATAMECGKNCLRKYDKVYRLFGNMEQQILQNFCDDSGFDSDSFAS